MKRTLALSMAALFLSLGIVPCALQAEDNAPPPPRQDRQAGFHGRRGPMRNGFFACLTKEERTKLMGLVKNVSEALTAYRANPGDKTKATVQTAVAAFGEYHQQLVIAQAEKTIAAAKERLANKDQNAVTQTERLLSAKGPGEFRHRGGNDSVGNPERKHGDRKGPGNGEESGRRELGRLLMQLLMTDSAKPMRMPNQPPPVK